MKKRIVIADDEPITRMDIREILEDAGYDVVGDVSDGFDAIEICRKLKPDLVLMDIKMPLLDGISAAKVINKEELVDSIILLTAYSDKNFIDKAKDVGVIGYLVKPVNEKSLLPAVEIALNKGREIKKIKKEIKNVNDKLNARKIIEKAKGILMEKHKLTEQEAYDKIRTLSMNKRTSMREIAEAILLCHQNEQY